MTNKLSSLYPFTKKKVYSKTKAEDEDKIMRWTRSEDVKKDTQTEGNSKQQNKKPEEKKAPNKKELKPTQPNKKNETGKNPQEKNVKKQNPPRKK